MSTMKKYKNIALLAAFFIAVIGVAGIATAHATPLHSVRTLALAGHDDACNGLSQTGGSCGSGQGDIGGVLQGVVTIISYIAGIIAVIMIIISSIRFITSNGDSNKVGAAKTALIYALIGIAVAGLAQILIHVVLSTAANP